MPPRRLDACRGVVSARRVFCTATLPQRKSRLPLFQELFSATTTSSSLSSEASSFTSPKRFPLHNVCVDPPLGAWTERTSQGQEATAPHSTSFLWLQRNLQLLEDGRGRRAECRENMPEGSPQWRRYTFSPQSCSYIYDTPSGTKLAFVTPDNYCHLCHEPVEVALRHCAWWDHVTRMTAIRLIAIHPRRWSPAAVMQEASEVIPTTVMTSPRPHPFLPISKTVDSNDSSSVMDMSSCYVFEKEAVVRRAELAAILRVLCIPKDNGAENDVDKHRMSIVPVLRESLILSADGNPASNIGERTFRAYVSRQISVLLPPMAPEPTTRIHQRCWGRKNLEMMFDFLDVASLQRLVGAPVEALTKNEKATVLRQMIYELATVLSEEDAVSTGTPHFSDVRTLTRLLVEMALQRLAHELIHLHTMLLMDQAYKTYVKLGYPSEAMMENSSFC